MLKQRFEMVQLKNGKQAIKCTKLVVLTGEELEKFTHKSLKKQIDTAAKDFHIEWGVEQNGGNIQIATLSRTFDVSFGDTEIHPEGGKVIYLNRHEFDKKYANRLIKK